MIFENKFKTLLKSIISPTDLVIYGWSFDGESDVEIDDDYSSFNIIRYPYGKLSMESDGFINICDAENFIKYVKENNIDLEDMFEATDAIYLPKFKGEISLVVTNVKNEPYLPSEYSVSSYIQHDISVGSINVILPICKNILLDKKNIKKLIEDGHL